MEVAESGFVLESLMAAFLFRLLAPVSACTGRGRSIGWSSLPLLSPPSDVHFDPPDHELTVRIVHSAALVEGVVAAPAQGNPFLP